MNTELGKIKLTPMRKTSWPTYMKDALLLHGQWYGVRKHICLRCLHEVIESEEALF